MDNITLKNFDSVLFSFARVNLLPTIIRDIIHENFSHIYKYEYDIVDNKAIWSISFMNKYGISITDMHGVFIRVYTFKVFHIRELDGEDEFYEDVQIPVDEIGNAIGTVSDLLKVLNYVNNLK